MRCLTCDYPLWNLTARKCPECGAPFKPSDFDFTINSVQFCCPHCRQSYYGTGERGHLVPRTFDCVSCAKPIEMDDMVLLPTEGVQEEQTRVDIMPWLERRSGSFIKAWWQTIWRGMTAPGPLMRATPIDSGAAPAIWFAVTVNAVAMLFGFGSLMIFGFFISGAFRGGGGGVGAALGGGLAISFLGITVLSAVMVFLWALTTHWLLALGGTRAGPMSRTIHALAYSAGPMILGAVPCMGMYISFLGWVWWLISATLMLKEAQRVSGGRAAFAVLTPPLTLFVVGVGGYIILAFYLVTAGPAVAGPGPRAGTTWQVGAAAPTTIPQQQADVQAVLDSLLRYGREGTGQGPPHAAELVRINFLSPMLVNASWSNSTPQSIPVGKLTLEQFTGADESVQRALVSDATAALPPGNAPYRFGDYIFADRGIDLANETDPLWVLISWPDPAMNPEGPSTVWVGTVQGNILLHQADSFKPRLDHQNERRARRGLPSIPDPSTILHPGSSAADPAPDVEPEGKK